MQGLDAYVEKAMIALTLRILANLVASPRRGGTPVDTGWARANWIPQISTAAIETAGTRKGVSRSAQISGQKAVVNYKLSNGPIFISNNVPYIVHLNNGSSKQAPRAFVQAAIVRAIQRTFKVDPVVE